MSWKRVLFRTHWLIGIVAGLVLAFVAATGALLSFKDEILVRMDTVPTIADDTLWPSPDRLLATVREQRPGVRVQMLSWSRAPYAVQARLQASPPNKPETLRFSADGTALIAPQRGAGFFESVEGLHRSLAAGPAGKAIIGVCMLGLMVLAISGLVLRWPRSRDQWKRLLVPNLKARGRALIWQLHAASGAWLCVLYLTIAATGLFWSFEWSRGLWFAAAGVPAPPPRSQQAPPPPSADIPLDSAFSSALGALGSPRKLNIGIGGDPAKPLEFRYLPIGASHDRAFGLLRVDPLTGAVLAREEFSELPRGRRLISAVLPLHTGSWFGLGGRILFFLAALCMPLFAVTGLWLWWSRRQLDKRRAGAPGGFVAQAA